MPLAPWQLCQRCSACGVLGAGQVVHCKSTSYLGSLPTVWCGRCFFLPASTALYQRRQIERLEIKKWVPTHAVCSGDNISLSGSGFGLDCALVAAMLRALAIISSPLRTFMRVPFVAGLGGALRVGCFWRAGCFGRHVVANVCTGVRAYSMRTWSPVFAAFAPVLVYPELPGCSKLIAGAVS